MTRLDCIDVATEEDSAALANLPTLTSFRQTSLTLRHADFLQRLPALTLLELGFDSDEDGGQAVEIPRVMAAMQTCTQLTELKLCGMCFYFTSEQLASCLERMPRLQSLSLVFCQQVESLSFLSVGALTATLTKLQIGICHKRIPIDELHKVHALRSLRSLQLSSYTFDSELSSFQQKLYTPPSFVLPALQEFRYQ